jgi:tetratricopeptide (TPR) repeat protein
VAGLVSTLHMAAVARGERDVAAAATRQAELERDATAAAKRQIEHEVDHARIESMSNQLIASFLSDTLLSSQHLRDQAERERVLATIAQKAALVRRQHAQRQHLQANLLDALGQACAALDAFAPAEALIEEAAALRAEVFGEDSLEYALSLGSLGQLHHRQGRLTEALEALRACYRLHKECRTDVHTDVARAANDLAAVERAAGNRARARELHLEALALRRRGGDPVLVAESLNNLANAEPDLARARELLAEAHQRRAEVLGPDDPLTLQSAIGLGSVLLAQGDARAARPALVEAVERSRRLGALGADNLAVGLRALAYAEVRLGEPDAARAAIDEALAIDREKYGGSHLRVAGDLEVLALLQDQRGQWAEAVASWSEVLRIRSLAMPAGSRPLALTECSLGAACARAGDVERALVHLGRALASHEAMEPRVAADLASTQGELAHALAGAGRFDEAERAWLAALALCEGDPAQAALAADVRRRLHGFYVQRNRPDDAARFAPPADAVKKD